MIRTILICNECEQTVINNYKCDSCGSHDVESIDHVRVDLKKPKKEDYK